MFATLTAIVLRLAAIRWAIKTLMAAGFFVPVAFLLKFIGLPMLAVMGTLALPVAFVLFLFGLPVFLVLIFAAVMLAGLFLLLKLGLVAAKILLFVVLPIWLVWKLGSWAWGRMRPVTPAAAAEAPVA